jgi:Holliday junction resolvase
MTARQEILEVARDLTDRGEAPFSPAQVVAELQQRGTNYRESTIRTYVVDVMCVDSTYDRATSYPDLRRVGRGRYVLADAAVSSPEPVPPTGEIDSRPVHDSSTVRSWSWEGNVQEVFVRFLTEGGWSIVSTADTATRQQGPDVVARRDGHELIVEVKGYPETMKASVNTQARHYVGSALLTALLSWAEHPNSKAGLVFPDVRTYRKLCQRLRPPLERLGISVWFVHEDGRVEGWLTPS